VVRKSVAATATVTATCTSTDWQELRVRISSAAHCGTRHEVRLMPLSMKRSKTNKNDYIDAKQSRRPCKTTMRFVPIKTDDQLICSRCTGA